MRSIKSAILAIFISLSMVSCVAYVEPKVAPTDFPVKPTIKAYSRQPVIDKKENDFLVSDEFVENSMLLHKYSERIDEWKKENAVK